MNGVRTIIGLSCRAFLSAARVCVFLFGLAPVVLAAGEEAPARPDATNALKRVHVYISGVVQGVGFRNFVRQTAVVHKITGWVRNLRDGRVELVAEGTVADIKELMEAVAKGPAGARVDNIERSEEPYKGEFERFEVRY